MIWARLLSGGTRSAFPDIAHRLIRLGVPGWIRYNPTGLPINGLAAGSGRIRMNATSTVVVIPCYNEAERIQLFRFRCFLNAHKEYHFLFVDDGSTDNTSSVLKCLRDDFPDRISIISLECNCGKAEAVRQGMLRALDSAPPAVAYWDADLATPLEEIPRFKNALDQFQRVRLVMGCRLSLAGHEIRRARIRCAAGKLFSTVASLVLWHPLRDTQCGAKMFRVTPELKSVFESSFGSRWIFDVEILGRMLSDGNFQESALFEMPLRRWTEIPGSRLSLLDCVTAARDLLWFGWHLRIHGSRPLQRRRRSTSTPPSASDGRFVPNVSLGEPPATSAVGGAVVPELSATQAPGRAA